MVVHILAPQCSPPVPSFKPKAELVAKVELYEAIIKVMHIANSLCPVFEDRGREDIAETICRFVVEVDETKIVTGIGL